MYYRSVDDLPLKTLFKIFETDDVYFLVKEYQNRDKVGDKELQAVWNEIEKDYRAFDKTKTVERVIKVSQKIDYFKAKHEMVSLCVYVLRFGRDDEVEQRLSRAGYHVDPGAFMKSLNDIEIEAKGLQTRVGINKSELERLTKDDSVVKSDINEMLASMSSDLGIAFKFNEITVVEFFGYKSALENITRKQKKPKGNGRR